MNRIFSTLLIALFFVNSASAQNRWHYLPNQGLTTPISRFDDVFFINKSVGFTINIYDDTAIYKTVDGGNTWRPVLVSSGVFLNLRSIEFLDDGVTGISGSTRGKVFRTTDTGNTWVDISSNIIDVALGPRSMCGLSHVGNTFYGVGWYGADTARFFKSTNKGITWQTRYIDTNLATNLVDVVFISPDTGFASGGISVGNNLISKYSVILKTTDGGVNWQRVFIDTIAGGRIWKLQAITKQVLVGSVESYTVDSVCMVKSTDGGNTWQFINTGIRAYGTQGIGFRTVNEGWVDRGQLGMARTLDGGQTWDTLAIGSGINRFFVLDSNHVFASGRSVYRYGDSANFTPVNEVAKVPHKLYPISPNPASGRVKIEFELDRSGFVVLDVVNLDMRKGVTLKKGILPAGKHIFYWDSSTASPGVYIVVLDNDELPLTQKFLLIK